MVFHSDCQSMLHRALLLPFSWSNHLISTFNWPHACIANTETVCADHNGINDEMSYSVNAISAKLSVMFNNLLYKRHGNTCIDTLTFLIFSNVMLCNTLQEHAAVHENSAQSADFLSITYRSSISVTVRQ